MKDMKCYVKEFVYYNINNGNIEDLGVYFYFVLVLWVDLMVFILG